MRRTRTVDNVELVLSHPDEVEIEWIGAPELRQQLTAAWLLVDETDLPLNPRLVGKPEVASLAAFLEPIEARDTTDVLAALRAFRERVHERSLVILISDLLAEAAAAPRGLRLLGSQRFDLIVLHVLSPQELHPRAAGTARLIDGETGDAEDLVIDETALRLYADRLNAFCEQWRGFCRRHDIRYVQASTATPFEECVLDTLRQGGLVR